jgi:translocator protein
METSSLVALAVFAALNFAVASTGAMFPPGAWYKTLRKPNWTPPNWVFPVVWSLLYCAIAVSGWLVWEAAGTAAWGALALYALSLMFNAAWSALFFGLRRLDWAMADVAALWVSIAAQIIVFAPISQTAALLLVPYLVWVSIAATLNIRLLQLNGAKPAAA